MQRWIGITALAMLVGFKALSFEALTQPARADSNSETRCPGCDGPLDAGWCQGCGEGHVGDQQTKCKTCFAAMKAEGGGWCKDCKTGYAHGHKTSCKGCFAAMQAKGGGWCKDCKTGYTGALKTECKSCFAAMQAKGGGWCKGCQLGYAKGRKTSCGGCLAAIQKDGACQDCGLRFAGGRAFQRHALHIHGLDAEGAAEKVTALLKAQAGVGAIEVDVPSGKARFELETPVKGSLDAVLQALKDAGFHAHEGDDKKTGAAPPKDGELVWLTDYDQALKQARAEGKRIFVDFFATWCGPCKAMDAQTFKEPRVRRKLAEFVTLKIDADQHQELARRYKVEFLPTTAVLESDGQERVREVGFQDAEKFLKLLDS